MTVSLREQPLSALPLTDQEFEMTAKTLDQIREEQRQYWQAVLKWEEGQHDHHVGAHHRHMIEIRRAAEAEKWATHERNREARRNRGIK